MSSIPVRGGMLRPSFVIDVYSHNFRVSQFDDKGNAYLLNYCRNLATKKKVMDKGKAKWDIDSIYAAADKQRTYYRFHFNQLDHFLTYLQGAGYHISTIHITRHEAKPGANANFTIKDKRAPRDYQLEIINYVANLVTGFLRVFKLVVLQTGKGKTFIALQGIAKVNQRVVSIIKPMYISKWIDDFNNFFDIKKKDIIVVEGSKNLKTLIELGLANKIDEKIIMISNRTYYNYLEDWERFGKRSTYKVDPNDFFRLLGAGFKLVDEVHQDFHLNYRCDLHTHIYTDTSLSATMEPDNPILKQMYEIMFPSGNRNKGIPYDKYITVKALFYGAHPESLRHLKWKNFGLGFYSQNKLEESIIKNRVILESYLSMISDIINKSFKVNYQPGQKFIVFAGSIEMATLIRDRLNRDFPEFGTKRYAASAGDDYQTNLLDPIGRVSTIKSAGTAIDIEGLVLTLMTDAMDTTQGNEQVLGRTRNPDGKFNTVSPVFIYLACQQIPSQLKYHEKKVKIFKDKVLAHEVLTTSYRI